MRHLSLTKIEGSDLAFENGMLVQKVQGGFSKTRRQIVGSPVVTSIELQLNPKQYNQWSYFYRYLINYGSEEFTADFIVDTWLVEEQVIQMTSSPVVSFQGFTAYVSFNIEVKRKQLNDEYLSEVMYTYGDIEEVCQILISLEDIANNKFNYSASNYENARIRGEGQRLFNPEDAVDVTGSLKVIANDKFLTA